MGQLELIKRKRFRLHSIAVELSGRGADRLAQDFDFYTDRPSRNDTERYSVTLELVPRSPRDDDLPAKAAGRIYSDHSVYREGGRVYYEYDGAVLVVERGENSSFGQLFSSDASLAREIGYLYLQSEIGRFLDIQGLHRVRALGLGLPSGKAALVILPGGSGKDKIAAEIMKYGRCVLLSEGMPLVDRYGRVHPYPLRLSSRDSGSLSGASLPRPGEIFHPGFLIVARRHGQRSRPSLRSLSRWRGAAPILRELVAGPGLPQLAELALSRGLRGISDLAPAAASRMAAAAAFLTRGRALRLDLARDPAVNAGFLIEELVEKRTRV
jgi:hypothetical protein